MTGLVAPLDGERGGVDYEAMLPRAFTGEIARKDAFGTGVVVFSQGRPHPVGRCGGSRVQRRQFGERIDNQFKELVLLHKTPIIKSGTGEFLVPKCGVIVYFIRSYRICEVYMPFFVDMSAELFDNIE